MTPCKHDFETYPDGLKACLNCGKTLYQITNDSRKNRRWTRLKVILLLRLSQLLALTIKRIP